LFRDGFRKLGDGLKIQRWLCRGCGRRFSEPRPPQENSERFLNKGNRISFNSQICDDLTEASKNLAITEFQTENRLAGATTVAADVKGKIIQHGFWMKKEGYAEGTISRRTRFLLTLAKRGANLDDPESVKQVIAEQMNWSMRTRSWSRILRLLSQNARKDLVSSQIQFGANFAVHSE
jgi:hypothetical protein